MPSYWTNFATAAAGPALACIITNPADVAKTRLNLERELKSTEMSRTTSISALEISSHMRSRMLARVDANTDCGIELRRRHHQASPPLPPPPAPPPTTTTLLLLLAVVYLE